MGDADERTELGPRSASAPVSPEVYAALDLLERHCTERVMARYPRAVDFVLALRRMVSAAGASAPFAGGIGPGDPGIDPTDNAAATERGALSP
jgi:hypothetical protein